METDLEKARRILKESRCTCVLCCGEKETASRLPGVRPLLDLLDSGKDYSAYSAADKVIGRGAAFLYCLLGVRRIYADVISRTALEVLEENRISVTYTTLVDRIQNRTKDGLCPIECATLHCRAPEEALTAIREALQKLRTEK